MNRSYERKSQRWPKKYWFVHGEVIVESAIVDYILKWEDMCKEKETWAKGSFSGERSHI